MQSNNAPQQFNQYPINFQAIKKQAIYLGDLAAQEYAKFNYVDAKSLYTQSGQQLFEYIKHLPKGDERTQCESVLQQILQRAEDCQFQLSRMLNSKNLVIKENNIQEEQNQLIQNILNPTPVQLPQNFNQGSYQQNQNQYQNQQPQKQNQQTDQKNQVPQTQKFQNPELIQLIENEIIDRAPGVTFDSIVGLVDAKRIMKETIILPQLKPELFTGLRQPPRGILLFGPPGNGKTMLAKAVVSSCNMTFYSISSSTLTSKYHGEGEKLVRALFESARSKQNVVIFMDEVDSLLSKRTSQEHEASTRLKTEFLVQFDGVISQKDKNNILIMGATNRPEELDEAVLRRFAKKIYIELPSVEARKMLIKKLLDQNKHNLTEKNVQQLAEITQNYSASDLTNLCKEAAMYPLRDVNLEQMQDINIREISIDDFQNALSIIKPTVSQESILKFQHWNQLFGSSGS